MKLNNYYLVLLTLIAIVFAGCKGEDTDKHHFDNGLYITSEPVCSDLLIKPDLAEELFREIAVRTAMPAEKDIHISFEAAPMMTAKYNLMYGDNAIALPSKYYEIPEKTTMIKAGAVVGDNVRVKFKGTSELNVDKRYVLPVTINSVTNIDCLESAKTVYFVFKRGALINIVANIAKIYFPVEWADRASVTGLPTITVEALIRCQDWAGGRNNPLSTIFGIENDFLIRVGDDDRPHDQLQFVVSGASRFPDPNVAPGLPVNEWVHIAIVYNSNTKERIYYQNGKVVASDFGASGTVSLGSNCFVGYSYNEDRWLNGEISELRVWNRQRTADEITNHIYAVDQQSDGLLAYWKFNEGTSNVIHDYTENGNDLISEGTPKWVNVELPKK